MGRSGGRDEFTKWDKMMGPGWSDFGGYYTDENGYTWTAEAAIMAGVAKWPPAREEARDAKR